MIPEQVKTNKNPRKNLASDDVSILDDWMDNDPAFNDNPDDDNDQENDVKQAEMEKPEEPTLQSKAETFVEFMKTVKGGILKCKNIQFFLLNGRQKNKKDTALGFCLQVLLFYFVPHKNNFSAKKK